MHSEPEDDDFVELERLTPDKIDTSVDVSVAVIFCTNGRNKVAVRSRALITFRREASAWLAANGPRFRILIGGAKANFIRIVPDAERGRFNFRDCAGGKTRVLQLGTVSAWPSERRQSTEAEWRINGAFLALRLPDGFAQTTVKVTTANAAVKGGALAPRVIDRRANGVVDLGTPAAGRSALDQRSA